MANAQTNVLVKIGAALNGGFRTAFQSADQHLKQLGQAASDMNAKLSTMRGFQQLEAATKQLATEWSQARAQARTLKAELDAMQPALQQQSAALKQANSELTRSGDRYRAAKIALEQMRAELKATVQPTQAQVEALKRAQQAAEQARGAWQSAKESARGLAADMKQADAAAREKARALQQAEQAAARAGDQFRRNREAMRGMREEMQRAGTDTKKLAEEQKKLEQQLAKTAEQQRKLAALKQARGENMQQRADNRGQLFDALAIGATMAAPIKAAVQFETAMLGIARQVEGARDDSGKLTSVYYDMGKSIQQLGKEIPLTTTEIASMVTAGARMGIPRDSLIEYTRLAAEMATAFDAVPEQLAEQMGKVSANFKIPAQDVRGLADSINYLDDQTLAKGSDIIDFMQRVGGTASMVKISAKDTAALGSTLLSLGEKSETAGTAINAVFSKLGAANTQSKPFQEMVKSLGMTTNELEKGMQTDAIGTIFNLMEQIRKLPKVAKEGGVSQIDAVSKLFGAEHWDTFSKLLENRGTLEGQIKLSNSDKAEGSMKREFGARMQTTAAQAKVFQNALNNVAVNIGTVLLPTINSLMSAFMPLVSGVATLAQTFPGVTKAVLGTVIALGALKVGAIASGYGMTFLRGAALSAQSTMLLLRMNVAAANAQLSGMAAAGIASATAGLASMRARMAALSWGGLIAGARSATMSLVGMGTAAMATAWGGVRALGASLLAIASNPVAAARTGFAAVTAGIRIMGAAMIANPIGLIATGIAVAGLLIYQNWERISAFFSGFAQGVMAGIGPAMPVFEGISNAVAGIFNWFSQLLSPVQATSAELAAATEAGKSFGQIVGQAIGAVLEIIGKVVGAIGSMTQAAVSGFNAVASFLGLGGSTPAAPGAAPATAKPATPGAPAGATPNPAGAAAGAAAAAKAPAAAAQPGAGGKTVNMTSSPTYNVNVNAQGNPDDIAKAVRKEQERMHSKNAAVDRASMHDTSTY